MLNFLAKAFFGKKIILFSPHRNSNPLRNEENRRYFFFLNPKFLWKLSFFFGRNSKIRYKAFAFMITVINPVAIIDINWINNMHTVYYIWCRNNNKKFLVLQHGTYAGGIIADTPHRMAKCQAFLLWSEYFKLLMEGYNKGKNVDFIVFGNPVYNQYDRRKFKYLKGEIKKILIVPSLVVGSRLESYRLLINRLVSFGYEVHVKEHNMQSIRSNPIDEKRFIKGDIFEILHEQLYDLCITDVSSVLNDIIFFKNKVLYYSPPGQFDFYTNNVYEKFLINTALVPDIFGSSEKIHQSINISRQEELFNYLVTIGDNEIRNYI